MRDTCLYFSNGMSCHDICLRVEDCACDMSRRHLPPSSSTSREAAAHIPHEGNVEEVFSRAGLLAGANTHPTNLARRVACSKNRAVFEPTVKVLSTDMYDSKFYDPSSRKTPRTRPRPRQRLHLPRRGGPAGLRQHAVCDAPRRPAPRRLALLRRRTATRPMSARAFGTRQLVAAGASPRLCTVSECEESCNQI